MGNTQVRPLTSLVVSSTRQFKIDGFGTTATGSGDDCVSMPRWILGGHEWEIRCYPASFVCNMWVSFKLALLAQPSAGNDDTVCASLGCRLINPAGTAVDVQHSTERTVSERFARRMGGESEPLVLAHRHDLEASGYIGDDGSIIVNCVVTMLREHAVVRSTTSEVGVPRPFSNLDRHLGELLRSGTGADVRFLFSGQQFDAHTAVLAARAPVLMAEFFADPNEKSARPRRLQVEGMNAADFKAMLRFIYTDAVPELDRHNDDATAMAGRLLAAADRYGLDRLKRICSRKLYRGVCVETAATTLALAERYKCPTLKARCVEFILGTPAILEAVLATEGYKQLETSCPSVLADLLKSARGGKN